MFSYKQYLFEKRKNQEQNPKISTLQKIKKYVNRDDLYVSFRTINKLGINPNSRYNTPNGIYGYWLKSYRNMINDAKPLDAPNKVFPYMAKPTDTEHFYIFKAKEDANVVHLGLLDEDTVKDYIYDYLEKHSDVRMVFIDQEILHHIKYYEQEINSTKKQLEKTKNLYGVNNQLEKDLLKYENELEELKNKMPDFSNLDKFVDYIYKKGEEEAEVKTPGGIFWWFGYYLYEEYSNKWNKFFRELGIDGVTDDKGLGIIHSNEPYQTVFFDGGKLKVVDSGFNKVYKQAYKFYSIKFKYELEDNVLVFDDIDISDMELKSLQELPWVKEGKQYKVTGDFACSGNQLTSLEGSPKSVGGNFYCNNNQLTTLNGGPSSVGGNFNCSNNKKKFTKEEVREVFEVKHKIYT